MEGENRKKGMMRQGCQTQKRKCERKRETDGGKRIER